jgi:adenylosuccinate synthase
MLDLDFGSYPFVTSSSTISAGACTGLGISPKRIGEVFGIFKAYCTRVGSGPFPTELNDDTGELIRKNGCEYGATTGRPRRCGWLDIPALKYAIMINGVTKLFMMKSDILSGFKTIKICTSYKVEGKQQTEIPFDNNAIIDPVYTEMEGWDEDISGIRNFGALPDNLRHYIEFIENQTGIPIKVVSVGPDRNSTIFR